MNNNAVGEKIKTLMEAKSLNFEELSQRSGLTVSQIQLLITSQKVASLGALIKIARGLGVRVGTFLDDTENLGPAVHRNSDRQQPATFSSQLSTSNSHLDFYALAGNKPGRHIEPFVIDIKPTENQDTTLSSHEGEEFIFVLSGTVKIFYGQDTYILQKGDSIYYDSIVDHLVTTPDSESAQIVAVVYTPL